MSHFLSPIHTDPCDFQRWTYFKWKLELNKLNFKIEKVYIIGKYYTHLADMIRLNLRYRFGGIFLLRIFSPFLRFLIRLDQKSFVKNNPNIDNFHSGYFIIAKK